MSSRQDTGLKRTTIDKYYTTPQIVSECIELFNKNVQFSNNDVGVEPSAGNGSFIQAINNLFDTCHFYDTHPEHPDIQKQNFLEIEPSHFSKYETKIHVIGNPPFGRQSSLAIKFIKKTCQFADTISFILPRSFKKESMKRSFSKYFHLKLEHDLPDNSFTVNGNPYTVPCVFQIWEKRDYERPKPEVLKPNGFKFVKKDESPDISFRRVGVYAGKISRDIEDKSTQSHYFIKFDKKITQDLFNKICKLQFKNKDDTVGARSISKQELIKELIKVF